MKHPSDPGLSAMMRRSADAIERSRKLMEATFELLRKSRALLYTKPVAVEREMNACGTTGLPY